MSAQLATARSASSPSAYSSAQPITPSPMASVSIATTCARSGSDARISRILAACAAVDTKIAFAPESARMKRIWPGGSVG